jgi:hypothetical protein
MQALSKLGRLPSPPGSPARSGGKRWGTLYRIDRVVLTKRDLGVAATGGHNIVTYFTNATNLRGEALCSGEPGGGRGIGVSAMQASLLFPRFRRTETNLLVQPITSG